MSVLTSPQRLQVYAAIMRWWSSLREPCAFSKPDLSAAVDAADQWADDNAANYNNALPVNFRTNATAMQKGLLLVYVIFRRIKRDGVNLPELPGGNGGS